MNIFFKHIAVTRPVAFECGYSERPPIKVLRKKKSDSINKSQLPHLSTLPHSSSFSHLSSNRSQATEQGHDGGDEKLTTPNEGQPFTTSSHQYAAADPVHCDGVGQSGPVVADQTDRR